MWKYLMLLFSVSVSVSTLQRSAENEFSNNHWVPGGLERLSRESVSKLEMHSDIEDFDETLDLASPCPRAEFPKQQPRESEVFDAAEDMLTTSNQPCAFISESIPYNGSSLEITLQDLVSQCPLGLDALEQIPLQEAGKVGDKKRHRRYIGDGHIGKAFRKLPNSTVTLVHCEQLMILKEEDFNGKLSGCILSKRLFSPEKQRAQLVKWKSLADLVIVEKSVDNFMDLVDACLKTEKSTISRTLTFKNIFRGIAPGTLWCGNNQLVTSLNQLGKEWKVDQCCRLHDLCPVQLPGLRVYKRLITVGPLMMSHCVCDHRFDRCLNKVKTLGARAIFHIYFNILYRTRTCVSDEQLAGSHTLHYKPFNWFSRILKFVMSVFEFMKEIKNLSFRRKVVLNAILSLGKEK